MWNTEHGDGQGLLATVHRTPTMHGREMHRGMKKHKARGKEETQTSLVLFALFVATTMGIIIVWRRTSHRSRPKDYYWSVRTPRLPRPNIYFNAFRTSHSFPNNFE